MLVLVEHNNKGIQLPLTILKIDNNPILERERDWMHKLGIYKSFHNFRSTEENGLITKQSGISTNFQGRYKYHQGHERTVESQTQHNTQVHESKNCPICLKDKGGGQTNLCCRQSNQVNEPPL